MTKLKIEAARRLKATDSVGPKTLFGIKGKLASLTTNDSSYELDEPATQATVSHLSNVLRRVPKYGRQGTTLIYVWAISAEREVALYIPATGKASIEVYNK